MDLSTILGLVAFVVLIFAGIETKQLTSSLVNIHGLFVVLGGSFVAMLLNTPLTYLIKALRS